MKRIYRLIEDTSTWSLNF